MKDKNFVIIINNAFKMAKNHIALGVELKKQGANVVFIFADKLPFYIEDFDLTGFETYIFSEYFEKNYNVANVKEEYQNINKIFFSEYDRSIVFDKMKFLGNDYYQKLMSNLQNFFEKIYKKHSINFCIYETISNSFAYTAYEVGLKNNVQYCGYAGSRLKGRFELYTEEFGSKELFRREFLEFDFNNVKENVQNEIESYLEQFENATKMLSYHPKNTSLDWDFSIFKRYLNKDKINLFIGSIKYSFKEGKKKKYSFQTGNPVFEQLKALTRQLKKKVITRKVQKLFDNPNLQESYFLYPQHFKPEASTSVLARHYCNDIAVIENIAFNLPFGSYLYVKEHFVNFGRLPVSYYKRLKNIPNVKLISYGENTKQLIEKSKGVITLTSTVGYEALLLQKPVYVFGNVFYECHPNCRKINSFDDLFEKLCDLTVNKDPNINRAFIGAYRKITFQGNIYYHIGGDDYTTDDFVKPIIKAIDERFFSKI